MSGYCFEVLALGVLVVAVSCTTLAPITDMIVPQLSASGVYLIQNDHATASAWIVQCTPYDEGYRVVLVTAAHFADAPDDLYMLTGPGVVLLGIGSRVHPTEDIALVEFYSDQYLQPRTYSVRQLRYGEELLLEGYPGGVGPYLRRGVYSGADRCSVPAWWGDSGGPISDSKGEVLGILVAGVETEHGPATSASFMVVLSDVEPWLRKELQDERFTRQAPGGEGEAVPAGSGSLGESEPGR